MRTKQRVAGAAIVLVVVALGSWSLGRSSARAPAVRAVTPTLPPSWLRSDFELEPAYLAEPVAGPWEASKRDVRWNLVGTDQRGRVLVVEPDTTDTRDGACDRFEARATTRQRPARIVVEVKAMGDATFCERSFEGGYGLPMSVPVPGGVSGRTITGKGMVLLPPRSERVRPGPTFVIPNVRGMSFAQARALLLLTGRPVLPTGPGQGSQDLLVTKQDPPGNALVPRSDRTSIVMTVEAR